MCGIVAYVGSKPALPILLEGLKRLEYRGYDSAGVALLRENPERVHAGAAGCGVTSTAREVGRVMNLEHAIAPRQEDFAGTTGVAHTRWATHGKVTRENAHPHQGVTADGCTLSVVHNGTIENYASLRTLLQNKGVTFSSETDTEVIAKLIADRYDADPGVGEEPGPGESLTGFVATTRLERATKAALRRVTGAYAVAVTCDANPHELIAARKGSPLIVGIADNGFVVASDGAAIVSHTTAAVTLADYQVVRLAAGPAGSADASGERHAAAWADPLHTTTLDDELLSAEVGELEMQLEEIELGGYPHFMIKEIMGQPESLRTCLRGRVDTRDGRIVLGGLESLSRELVRAKRVSLIGQGTAFHAGLIGEYLFEDLAKIPARAHYASELRYRNPIIEEGTVVDRGVRRAARPPTRSRRSPRRRIAAPWRSAPSTSSAARSPAKPTPGSTSASARRSASPARRPSSARSPCSR